ncbi:MAG: hypothetical protein M3198_16400 [Actinomycetota bacterium]|nr:hypothetical protein [Actinomycetota bacterium]
MAWTLVAFGAHLAFGLITANMEAALSLLQGDDVAYHAVARQIVDHWISGLPAPSLPPGKEGYYYVLATLYRIFGPQKAAGFALNAALAAALIPLVSDLTRIAFGTKAARYVPPLAILPPSLFVLTSLLLKEAAVLFLIVTAANCAIRVARRASLPPLVGLAASLSLLFTFRGPVALAVAMGLLLGIALARRGVGGLTVATGAVVFLAVLIFALGLGYSGYKAVTAANLETANNVRLELSTSAGSGFAPQTDVSTPQKAIAYLPLGLATFMLGPFPWHLEGGRQLLALPDVLVWWVLLLYGLKGLRAAWGVSSRSLVLLLAPAFAVATLLSLTIGNFGTLLRERLQVMILVMPFIALGLSRRKKGTDLQGDTRHMDEIRKVGRNPTYSP